ncbi:hypothetical protein SVAN01_09911 [Stagonosporopsis vannaccii]|nr:hypothetical protein SVAN01_09911 [Stagonosporopsis vannaccii]
MVLKHRENLQGAEEPDYDVDGQVSSVKRPGPSIFRPAALHVESSTPLPNRLDAGTWRTEYVHHKQLYVDAHGGSAVYNTQEYIDQQSSRHAHRALINGEFGIKAPVSCENCTKRGHKCRVYHPDCYKWDLPGRNAEVDLGWRCSVCRIGEQCVFPVNQPSKTQSSSSSSAQAENRPSDYTSNHNQHSTQNQARNAITSAPRKVPPLPASITQHTWTTDFEAAKRKFLDNQSTRMEESKSKNETANRIAHQELVHGRYGVRAIKACEQCSDAEKECRTYHPQCYEWLINERSAIDYLGWRCGNCRFSMNRAGCNVQWK